MFIIQNVGSNKIILAKKWMCIVMISLTLLFLCCVLVILSICKSKPFFPSQVNAAFARKIHVVQELLDNQKCCAKTAKYISFCWTVCWPELNSKSYCRLYIRRDLLLLLFHKYCWFAKPFILSIDLLNSSHFPTHSHLAPMSCLGLVTCCFCSSTMQTHWNGNQSKSCFAQR